jgi:ribosomal protein S18 acetylase RimI-like enzyme
MEFITISSKNRKYIHEVAHIHKESLPNDFLPSLGLDFLENVFYKTAAKSNHAAIITAVIKKEPAGFVVIAHDSDEFSKDVTFCNLGKMFFYSIRLILNNYKGIKKIVELMLAILFKKEDPIKGEIVVIAVNKKHMRKGIGKKLVIESMKYLKSKGNSKIRIKTLSSNVFWVGMFIKMGWQIRKKYRLIGKEYVTIVGEINS